MIDLIKNRLHFDSEIRSLLKGSFDSFVIRSLGMLFSYIFAYLVSFYYGAAGWGIFSIAFTILQISSVLGRMGFDTAFLRITAELNLYNDIIELKRVYKKILFFILPSGLLLTSIIYILSDSIAQWFNKEYLGIQIKILSFSVIPSILLFVNFESLRGFKKIKVYSFLNYTSRFFFASLIIPIIVWALNEDWIPIFVFVLSVFISYLISQFLLIKLFRNLNQHKFFKKNTSKNYNFIELFKTAFPMFLTNSLAFLLGWTATLILGYFRTDAEVGIYNIALKAAMLTSLTLTAVNSISAPKFAEYWSKNDMNSLKKVAQNSTKLIFWTSVPILILFTIFPKTILSLFGKQFEIGWITLLILTFAQFLNAISGSVGYLLQMTGKEVIFQYLLVIATLINIIFNILLTPTYGIIGAAIANLIALFLINIIPIFIIKHYYNFYIFNPKIIFSFKHT